MVSRLRARPPATRRRATASGDPANQRTPLEVLTCVGAGLKLDDVRNEWHPDVQTAISRLSPEELSNRNKRLKRAMDLSLKHSELNKEAQAAVEPLVGYLPLERAREERLERCMPFQPPASFPPPILNSLLSLLASPFRWYSTWRTLCGPGQDWMCGNRVARGSTGLSRREGEWTGLAMAAGTVGITARIPFHGLKG